MKGIPGTRAALSLYTLRIRDLGVKYRRWAD
jgi:hypothetical protein